MTESLLIDSHLDESNLEFSKRLQIVVDPTTFGGDNRARLAPSIYRNSNEKPALEQVNLDDGGVHSTAIVNLRSRGSQTRPGLSRFRVTGYRDGKAGTIV